MTVNTQKWGSILRQAAGYVGIVMAALTQALSAIKLPPVASGVMGALGVLILGIEHYVSDPSTGTATVPVATSKGTIPVPVAPVAVTAPQAAGGVGHIDPVTTVVQGPVTVSGFPAVVPQGNPAPPPPSNA
jgi:hypothetical protein